MNSKIAITIATIAIIAVAAVGIGYAYTASTTNSGNVVSTEFVELKQENVGSNLTGAYQFVPDGFNIYYDSENVSATVTNYTITNAKVQIDTNGDTTGGVYTAIQMGNPFKLTATKTGGTSVSSMTCKFETSLFNAAAGWNFIIKFEDESQHSLYAIGHDGSWSHNSFSINTKTNSTTLYQDTTITVYYGYEGDGASTTAAPSSQPLGNGTTGASIKFTVERGNAITEVDSGNIATINRTMANPGELVTITIASGKTATIAVVETDGTTTVSTTTTGQITTFVMPNYAVTVTITETTNSG